MGQQSAPYRSTFRAYDQVQPVGRHEFLRRKEVARVVFGDGVELGLTADYLADLRLINLCQVGHGALQFDCIFLMINQRL